MPQSAVLFPLIAALAMCAENTPTRQTPRGVSDTIAVTEAIDWSQSAGIFIGIETFRSPKDAPVDVQYAADDATDLAWAFARELPSLLRPERTVLLLSGRPDKPASQEHLLVLQKEGSVVGDGVDAAAVYAAIRKFGGMVGPDGVLVLSIATHGYTTAGAHVLLMPEATTAEPKGVVLDQMLRAIPPGHNHRVLLFVDACRDPYSAAPQLLFEDLRFAGDYAIFAASRPGGFAYPDSRTRNGHFTRAIVDGLLTRAAGGPDGFVTPSTLDAHVSAQVKDRSAGAQRPESRFGALADLPLFRRLDPSSTGAITEPPPNALVAPSGTVAVRADLPNVYVTVLVCSTTTGRCWKQNDEPARAGPEHIARVPVQYGSADRFEVHAAVTADKQFLRNEKEFPTVPLEQRGSRIVSWLRPVHVILEEEKKP